MKRLIAIMMLALCSVPLCAKAESVPATDFTYCADLQGEVRAESLYQIHLPGTILQKAGADLQDIRVLDSSQKETPFIVIGNVPPHETIETYPLEIVGYDHDASSASVIMKLPQKHRSVSVLDLDIADRDFKKRIVLDGSSDGKVWQTITEGSVYDFTSQVDVRKTRLEFADTDARFLRIKLIDLRTQQTTQPSIKLKYEGLDFSVNNIQNKNLRIRAARASTGTPAEKKPVYDQTVFTSLAPSLDKDGNTVIVLPAALPLDLLTLDVANPYYHRIVNLYTSSTGKDDSYRLLTSQTIYRFPLSSERHEERNSIEQHAPKQAYYKIVIMNRNNPPLELKSISFSWVQQNLYFIALKNSERYAVCYGNTQVKRPDYDLASFVNKDTLSQHRYEPRKLSPVRIGSGPKPTFRERLAGMEKTVLTMIVVVLVLGMGWWLYALLKKRPDNR